MADDSPSPLLFAVGAAAAGIGAIYVPKHRAALGLAAGGLGLIAAKLAYDQFTKTEPGHAGGFLGWARDTLIGKPITATSQVPIEQPNIGGISIAPGKVALPDGSTFDGIDPFNLSHQNPVTGVITTPPEGGSIDRAAYAAEYLVSVNVTNRTSYGITGRVELDITEDHLWPIGPRTTHAASNTVKVGPGETLPVEIVASIAPNNDIVFSPLFSTPARMVALFAGFIIATRSYRVM